MLRISNKIISIILVFSCFGGFCGCNNKERSKELLSPTDYIEGGEWYFEKYPAKGNWILSDEILLKNEDEYILTSRKKIQNTIADYIIDHCFDEYTKYIDKNLKRKNRKSVIRSIKNFNAIRQTLNYEYLDFWDCDASKDIITIDNVSDELFDWIVSVVFWYDDITLELYESACEADYEFGKIGIFIDLEFKNKSFQKYEEGERSPYRFEFSPDRGAITSKEPGGRYNVTGKCCENPKDSTIRELGINDEYLMYFWVTDRVYSVNLLYLKNTDKIYMLRGRGYFILERTT